MCCHLKCKNIKLYNFRVSSNLDSNTLALGFIMYHYARHVVLNGATSLHEQIYQNLLMIIIVFDGSYWMGYNIF